MNTTESVLQIRSCSYIARIQDLMKFIQGVIDTERR